MDDNSKISDWMAEKRQRQIAEQEAKMAKGAGMSMQDRIAEADKHALSVEMVAHVPKEDIVPEPVKQDSKKAPKKRISKVEVVVDDEKKIKAKSSQYRGVSKFGTDGKWTSCIGINGKRNLSYWDSEIGAAKEYDRMALKFKGRDAKTNFPAENYEIEPTAADRVYEDHDIVISTSLIRSAMIAWCSKNDMKYRTGMANWSIMEDLFFFGKGVGAGMPETLAMFDKLGLDKNIRY